MTLSEHQFPTICKPSDFIERNNIRAFLVLFRDWMAIVVLTSVSIWANNIFVYLVSVWVIGIFQVAIGEGLLHEATHYNLFEARAWNEKLEFLYGFPFFRTVSSYQKHHLPHHKYLKSEKDSIPKYYERLGLNKPNKNLFFLLFIQPMMGIALYEDLRDILFHLKQLNWRPFKSGFKLLLFWLIVVLSFSLSGNLEILLLYWFVPLLGCFSYYMYWSEIEDHFNTISGTRSNLDFLTNWLLHNTKYHSVHHQYPTIPWYKLPLAHKALCSDIPDISYGFVDSYRQMVRNDIVTITEDQKQLAP